MLGPLEAQPYVFEVGVLADPLPVPTRDHNTTAPDNNAARRPDNVFPDIDPLVLFDVQRANARRAGSFPRTLKIAMWNCRGLKSKFHDIWNLMETLDADIVILNETFRSSKTIWPSKLPPCLAEATFQPDTDTGYRRNINGVAVLVNPRSIRANGAIRKFEIIEVDNVLGTKVVLKINNFILYAVYTPTSMGVDILSEYLLEARSMARDGQAVVFCGDLNAIPVTTASSSTLERSRHQALMAGAASILIRADTGPLPTRPVNPHNPNCVEGNILDHILGAHVDFIEPCCVTDLGHSSDHHPIMVTVRPMHRAPDDSIKYWRLRTERLQDDSFKSQYVDLLVSKLPDLQLQLQQMVPETIDRSFPISERRRLVDRAELLFVNTIMNGAKAILGKKTVPVVAHSSKRVAQSPEYLAVRARLSRTYERLRYLNDRSEEDTEVSGLLESCLALKATLARLEKQETVEVDRAWTEDLCNLNVCQRAKILNRAMRKRSTAGSSLPTTSSALASHRDHFRKQFTNGFDIEPYTPSPFSIEPVEAITQSIEMFVEENVSQFILGSKAGKAPGLTGLSVDLLQPIASEVAPILVSLFCLFPLGHGPFVLAAITHLPRP